MAKRLLAFAARAHGKLRQTEHTYMVVIAAVIGLLGGLCAVGFRELIELTQQAFWRNPRGGYTLELIRGLPWYWKVLAPATGGLVVGLITYYFAREAKGHGVPEVMEAVAIRGGIIRMRVMLAKMFASAVCIASGGSVGREGPIVQIGSSLGSSIGQLLRLGQRRLRTLVGCGAAAGIAGTFNAPVAGALFAVEVIVGDFGVSQFSPIVISSVIATVVTRHMLGNEPAFVIPEYSLVHANELIAYAVLGILAGLAALAFVKMMYKAEDLFDALPVYPPLRAVAGGVLIGVIALQFPQVYGVGYETIGQALGGNIIWHLLLVLVLVKILSVAITIGSGGSGGIFAPSLFIGAMLGGAVGTIMQYFWPEATGGPGAYALAGMGAVVAAATHAPITAILIIFELTDDYEIILPLMISCVLATLLAMRLSKGSIYTLKLLRRGIDVTAGQSINVLRDLKVRDLVRKDVVSVGPDEPLMGLLSRFMDNPDSSVFVVDEDRRLLGVITMNEVRPIMDNASSVQFLLIARDMMVERGFPTVGPEDTLDGVMKRLGDYRFEVPILENGRLVGTIWPEDVIKRYNAEVFDRDMASSLASSVGGGVNVEAIPGVEGISLAEIHVPPSFVGTTLAQLDIRKRFDVTVLLVKQKGSTGEQVVKLAPDAKYVFQESDVLLVMGAEDQLQSVERSG